jgi:hypothetical protein
MSSDYDATEFIDSDFQAAHKVSYSTSPAGGSTRAPSREEIDSRVGEAQQKLAELRRVQEELERERASLEETRRRQIEFQTGRQEALQNLTRGVGLLEEAEFAARRDAEQMAKSLADMREALAKVEAIHEENWTKENFAVELTRGLTSVENARMEWNAGRLKFPVLGAAPKDPVLAPEATKSSSPMVSGQSFLGMCKMGLALTWPVVLALIGLSVFLAVLLQRR